MSKWINVKDRLPKERREALISVFYKNGADVFCDPGEPSYELADNDCVATASGYYAKGIWYIGDNDEISGYVYAWKPLPMLLLGIFS